MKIEELLESFAAVKSFLKFEGIFLRPKKWEDYQNNWYKIDRILIGKYALFLIKNKKEPTYELGFEDRENNMFGVVFSVQLFSKIKTGQILGYDNLYQEIFLGTDKKARRKNIAKTMYRYLLKNMKMQIMADSEHYFGARKLWFG